MKDGRAFGLEAFLSRVTLDLFVNRSPMSRKQFRDCLCILWYLNHSFHHTWRLRVGVYTFERPPLSKPYRRLCCASVCPHLWDYHKHRLELCISCTTVILSSLHEEGILVIGVTLVYSRFHGENHSNSCILRDLALSRKTQFIISFELLHISIS